MPPLDLNTPASAAIARMPRRISRPTAAICLLVSSVLLQVADARAATLEEKLLAEKPEALAAEARKTGDARRGAAVFHGRAVACAACHAAAGDASGGQGIGPALTTIDASAGDAAVVESILQPEKVIAPAYVTTTLELADGRVLTGMIVEDGPQRIVIRDAARPDRLVTLTPAEIESRSRSAQSVMPAGQVNQLQNKPQFLDLVRYVLEVRDGGASKAAELAPPPNALAWKFPDEPRTGRPVVQRGDLAVGVLDDGSTLRIASAIAVGFETGSVAFDAATLEMLAAWRGGFVRHSAQPYFGVFWHRDGRPGPAIGLPRRPLLLRRAGSEWRGFEVATTSDPNSGSRFLGHEVAEDHVRLSYRGREGASLVGITESVRVEERSGWFGVIREFHLTGLPPGGGVAVVVSGSSPAAAFRADGTRSEAAGLSDAMAVTLASPHGRRIVVASPGSAGNAARFEILPGDAATDPTRLARFEILPGDAATDPTRLAVTTGPTAEGTAALRVATWHRDGKTEPTQGDIAAILSRGGSIASGSVAANAAAAPAGGPRPPGQGGSLSSQDDPTLTSGTVNGYEMASIPSPFAGCRVSDVAFSDDGHLYCLAMTEGEVWRTRLPPPDRPHEVAWKRHAVGLYHPIGIAVVDGRLYVAQKPEITELIDADGDGVVERQRTVATGWGLSTGWHEYCFGLAVDSRKDLWFALNTGFFWTNPGYVNPGRFRGSILKVEHGTERLVEVATGCRVPNGIATNGAGEVFFTDNQGDWIQSCKLARVVPGRFFGHPETKADALAEGTFPDGRVAVWMPYDRSRSTSGPACDTTGGRFGPFAGQWFLGDVGYGANTGIVRAAIEEVDGECQGAVMPFIDGRPRGCERMKFGPDGRLYMATLTDGIVRARFTGAVPLTIRDVAIRPAGAGFTVRLTQPLAESCVVDATRCQVRRWHYVYSGKYGSPQANLTTVPVAKADLSSDRMRIDLTLPVESHPIGMVYELSIPGLVGVDGGKTGPAVAWYTVHRIPK